MFDTIIFIFAILLSIYWILRRVVESFKVGNLDEKPVLITGCDSGFGYSLALKCVSSGIPVFAACLTQQGADQLEVESSKITRDSRLLTTFLLEVSSEDSVQNAKNFIENEVRSRGFGGLHALVNNAAIIGNSSLDDWLRPEDYDAVWKINTLGLIRVTHAFKSLVKKTKGRIINTSSICGRVSLPGMGPYSVSKYAVQSYNDTLRLEMSQFGVSVSLVEPGYFKTPITCSDRHTKMIESVWRRTSEETKEEYGEKFFQYVLKAARNKLNAGSSRPELVVEAYFHAITSVLPRKRYHVGNDCVFGYIPFSMLPAELQDLAFAIGAIVDNSPKAQKMVTK